MYRSRINLVCPSVDYSLQFANQLMSAHPFVAAVTSAAAVLIDF